MDYSSWLMDKYIFHKKKALEGKICQDIIEVLERSGEKVGVRHILIKTKTTDEDKEKTYQNSLVTYQKIKTKDNFITSALDYSNDETTKENGGYLGWIDAEYYQVKELASVIKNIENNICSAPIFTNFGYHLLVLSYHCFF